MASRDIPDLQLKILCSRSGNQCAFPSCEQVLAEPGSAQDRGSYVGEIAHIVAHSDDGPRGDKSFPENERNMAGNLVLLCGTHHKIVDDQENTYSVRVLRQMKASHEARFAPLAPVPDKPALINELIVGAFLRVESLPPRLSSAPCLHTNEGELRKQLVEKLTEQITAIGSPPADGGNGELNTVGKSSSRPVLSAFILRDRRVYTFADLLKPNAFSHVITPGSIEHLPIAKALANPDKARWYVELLNRTLSSHLRARGVFFDRTHGRHYFPATKDGKEKSVTYRTVSGRKATRRVAYNPKTRMTGEGKRFWIHVAASLRFHYLGSESFVLSIQPDFHLTHDGVEPLPPERIGPRVTKMKSRMYNSEYLKVVQFWAAFLSDGKRSGIIESGGSTIIFNPALPSGTIEWPGAKDAPVEQQAKPEQGDLFDVLRLEEALARNESAEMDVDEEMEDVDGLLGEDEDDHEVR